MEEQAAELLVFFKALADANRLKIIGLLGPFPGPPLAAHLSLPVEMRDQLRQLLSELHLSEEGRAILDASHISHFEPVSDAFYRQLAEIKLPTPGS